MDEQFRHHLKIQLVFFALHDSCIGTRHVLNDI